MDSEIAYFPDALVRAIEVRLESAATRGQARSSRSENESSNLLLSASAPDRDTSDELLLKDISAGVKEALGYLFHRYARLVRAVAHRIVRDESEADDLVQEVFLFIYRKARLFDASRGSARSWIVQITYHRAIDRRRYLAARHFYNRAELDETLGQAEKNRSQDDLYERSAVGILGREKMQQLVELLSADQQRVLDLYFYEGYTLEEVAQTMQQSIGNIRNHYYRGLEKLRRGVFEGKLKSK